MWYCYTGVSSSLSAPYFTMEPRSSVARRGAAVTLYCAASCTTSSPPDWGTAGPPAGRGDVTVTWIHNGVTLDHQSPSPPSSSSRVDIKSLSDADEGLYQCIGDNSVGAVISRPATLLIAGNSRCLYNNKCLMLIELIYCGMFQVLLRGGQITVRVSESLICDIIVDW